MFVTNDPNANFVQKSNQVGNRGKNRKNERAAVGSSMMSISSNEERDSKARRPGQAPVNVSIRGASTMQGTMGERR